MNEVYYFLRYQKAGSTEVYRHRYVDRRIWMHHVKEIQNMMYEGKVIDMSCWIAGGGTDV